MLRDVRGLKQAYDFYKQAESDKEAIACGCMKDAEQWLWKELNMLFDPDYDPSFEDDD